MTKEIVGMAVMAMGALITFLSAPIAKKLLHVEEPKASLQALILKFMGLGVAAVGMLLIMDIL